MNIKGLVALHCADTGDTRQSIAHELGISPRSLYSKLNGNSEFKLSEAERLSEILGCSVDELKGAFVG